MRWTGRGARLGLALGTALFQVVGSFGAADNQPERKDIDALALAFVLLGPIALAVSDRHPRLAVATSIGAATVYVGLGYPYGPIFVSVAVSMFLAVQAGELRATIALAVAGYVAFMGAYAVDARAEEGASWLHWSLVAGWVIVVLTVSELVRSRRQHLADRARAERDERERRVSEQRLGLAQELHDVLAHNISLINVQASVALHLLDEQPDRTRPALTAIKDASHEALQELRGALDVLRRGDDSAPRTPAPRLAELPGLVDGVRASGLEVRLEGAESLPALPAAVELAAYRIVQEALTNITRHAGARSASVRLGYDDGVTIEVLDDGTGGAAEPGNGIRGMQERASALGGHVETGPRPTGGFRVAAHLPAGSA
jgi:signal transduction histidine kinase